MSAAPGVAARAAGMVTEPVGTSLARLQERMWERTGADAAVVHESQRHDGLQLAARVRRLAHGFIAAGVRPGDRVAVCMANSPDVGVVYGATWRAGGVATPLLFLLTAPEIAHVLRDSGAAFLVTTAEFLPKAVAAAAGTGARVVLAGPGEPASGLPAGPGEPASGVLALDELEAAGEGGIIERRPEDLAALLYTGGTTGRSKGVMLSHDAVSSAAWASTAAHRAAVGSSALTGLSALPMSHVFGLSLSVRTMHVPEPTTTVLMRWFDPAGWLELAERHRVDSGAVVPSMLQMLLAEPLEQRDLSALRYVVSGGAPLAPEVAAQVERRLPGVQVLQGYGCTESAAIITTTPPGRARRGSVGVAPPLLEVRVERPDGSEAAAGEDGEVCARGPQLMSGYWQSPEETAHVLRGGWLHTGDVGHLDADGYLHVVDRLKDVVIRGGINVYPADVEAALLEHPDVTGAGVVGRPDERMGEEVVAFVVTRPASGLEPADVVAFARERLSPAKYPREVRLVEALPLTSVGKLDRKALRARLAAAG